MIDKTINNNLRNTNNFNVIITNCKNYCQWAGPHIRAVQLEKWRLRPVPWQIRAGDAVGRAPPWHAHEYAGVKRR